MCIRGAVLLLRVAVCVAVCVAAAGCGADECTRVGSAEALADALADAASGDRLCLADGRFEGAFEVPPNVDVEICGAGREFTAISGGEGEIALLVRPQAGAHVELCDLRIEWQSRAGLVASGAGSVSLRHVDLQTRDAASTGVGLAAEDLSSLTLVDVAIRGPVTEEAAADYALPSPEVADWVTDLPAPGAMLVHVADGTWTDVEVSGFAVAGVELVDSAVAWSGGAARTNLGAGVLTFGGALAIDAVEVTGLVQGGRLAPTTGMSIAGGAVVQTNGLRIVGNGAGSLGVLQHDSTASHEDLGVSACMERGYQLSSSTGTLESPVLEIAGGDLSDCGYAGLVLAASSGIVLEDVTVDRTTSVSTVILGEETSVGDGIQVLTCADPATGCAEALDDVVLRRVQLGDNTRVGLLVSGDDQSLAGVSVEEVSVSGSGVGVLGAVYQSAPDAPAGWASIERSGDVVDADAAFDPAAEALARVGIIDPEWMPEQSLSDAGLAAALGAF